jgi:AbrB family looped-hinge helix DNA binding protein
VGNRVGPKGQVVIEKAIRDQLGIEPGSVAIQRVVDGRVELRFLPPRHNRSLFGAARPFVKRWPTQEELDDTEWYRGEEAGQRDRELVEELLRRDSDSRDQRARPLSDRESAEPG